MHFFISIILVNLVLTFFCFYIPSKVSRKISGLIISITFLFIQILLLFTNGIYIFYGNILILIFQIIILTYWVLRYFQKPKLGIIISSIVISFFVYIVLSPWIEDWLYGKEEVNYALNFIHINLKDDYEIIENEITGLSDYYETFTLQISKNDTKLLQNKAFKNAKINQLNILELDFHSSRETKNGTFHFVVTLDTINNYLSYTGSDE
jgi:hypothetical protein